MADEAARVVAQFRAWQSDPEDYVDRFHHIPRETVWPKTFDIMRHVERFKYTLVPAGHNLAKTFSASLVAWWFKQCFVPSKVIITAPGSRQAGLVIGNEITARYENLKRRYSPDVLAQLKLDNPPNSEGFKQDAENFMTWFATKPDQANEHATKIAGFHSPHLLFIFEEFGGIHRVIYEATQGSMVAPGARFLGIGNPSDPTSVFAKLCRAMPEAVIRLNAEEFPNVVEDDPTIFPWGPTRQSLEELALYWGRESGAYQWKALGLFPTVATDTLIGYSEVQAALDREPPPCSHPGERIGLGCDVARTPGGDDTVIFAVCADCGSIIRHERRNGQNLMGTSGQVLAVAAELGIPCACAKHIAIDDTGLGGGVTDRLRELGWNVDAVNFGAAPTTERKEVRFQNRRIELWWELREWVRHRARLAGMEARTADRVREDLTSVKLDAPNSDGRIRLESKEKAKKRLGRSPDDGDALALAAWAARLAPDVQAGIGSFLSQLAMANAQNRPRVGDADRPAGRPGGLRTPVADRYAKEWGRA